VVKEPWKATHSPVRIMTKRIGLLIPGLSGAIGTTVISVLDLMRQGYVGKYGMICEMQIGKQTLAQIANALEIEDIMVGGWDVSNLTIGKAMKIHGVLGLTEQQCVAEEIKQ